MDEKKKLAVKKFLYGIKNAVMAMDIETLKDETLAEIANDFENLIDALNPEESSSN